MRELKFRQFINGNFHYAYFKRGMHIGFPSVSYDIEQFTGLLDKNGLEIYEGDIVELDESNYYPGRHIVEYEYTGFKPFSEYDCDCEKYNTPGSAIVIGNIHENPDMIDKA